MITRNKLLLGEKPYCCLVCPRAFNQRVVLREHIRSHHSAPDPVHGTTLTPYFCSLCGDLFAVSLDLIHHLIEHSDRSTAAKRVQPTGPRKYKRRRKLNGDSDNSDFVTVETNFQRAQKAVKHEPVKVDAKKNIFSPLFSISNSVEEFQLPKEIFEAAGKRVPVVKQEEKKPTVTKKAAMSGARRPKMIYTQKTRVAVSDGKRKTKTMIQKQVLHAKAKTQQARGGRQQKQDDEIFNHDESSETWSNDDPNDDVLETLMKRERKLSEKFTIDLVNDLQEILRSPLKTNEDRNHDEDDDPLNSSGTSSTRRSRRQVMSRYGSAALKRPSSRKGKEQSPELSDDEEEEMERVLIKQEVVDGHLCGICGDSFVSRTQLLNHVPVHI